jgi:hypothetical protein
VADSAEPGRAEVEAGQGLQLVKVRVRDAGKVAAQQDAVGLGGQARQQRRRERRDAFHEVGEHHRGVEMDAGIAVGEVEEVAVFRRPEVGDDRGQPGMAGEHLGHRSRAGVRSRHGSRAAVHDYRDAGLGEQAPHRIKPFISRVVAAHLHVRLEQPRAVSYRP